jgi:integrase
LSVVKHQGSKNWYYSFQLNGVKYFKSCKTTNKALARQIEAKAYEQAVKDAALGRVSEQITLLEAFDMYVESKVGTPYHKVLTSVRNPVLFGHKRCNKTKQQVKVYCLDRDINLHLLRSSDMHRLVEARRKEGLAEATIKQHCAAISGAWVFAKQHGYLVDEAMSFPTFRNQRKEVVFLTPEEETKLIDSLDPKRFVMGYGYHENRTPERQQRLTDQRDFVVCLLDSGCRFSEMSALEWTSVNLETGVAYVYQKKTKKSHTIYLTARMLDVLKERAENKTHEKWVFPNDNRDGPRPFHNCWFNRTIKRAGIDKRITHHSLRKTFASKLVIAGTSLYEVSTLLGHSSVSTTTIYAGLIPMDVSRKAADTLNRLNEQKT